MKNIKKLFLLFLFIGSFQPILHSSEPYNPFSDSDQELSSKNDKEWWEEPSDSKIMVESDYLSNHSIDISALEAAIASKVKNQKTDISVMEQADKLIQQNYKTDKMKYDILLLTNKDPFMQVNVYTASINNLPTINEVLSQSYKKDIEKVVIVNGLKAALRAISGALADDSFDNTSIFSKSIAAELNKMNTQVENRLKEVNPISWLKLYVGIGTVASVATIAAIYYSGITAKDTKDYLGNLAQGIATSINSGMRSAAQSTVSAASSAAGAVKDAASSAISSTASSAGAFVSNATEGISSHATDKLNAISSAILPTKK